MTIIANIYTPPTEEEIKAARREAVETLKSATRSPVIFSGVNTCLQASQATYIVKLAHGNYNGCVSSARGEDGKLTAQIAMDKKTLSAVKRYITAHPNLAEDFETLRASANPPSRRTMSAKENALAAPRGRRVKKPKDYFAEELAELEEATGRGR